MFNTTQDEQNQKMMDALKLHFASRGTPKPPAPVNNELAEYHLATARHAARENAKRMEELNECFRLRNAQRANKSS